MRILSYQNVAVPATTAHSLYTVRTSAELSLSAPVTMIASRRAMGGSFDELYGFCLEDRPHLELALPPTSNATLASVWRRLAASRWIGASRGRGSIVFVTQARPLRHFARMRKGRRERFTLVVECHSLAEPWGSEIETVDGILSTTASLEASLLERFPALRQKPRMLSPHRVVPASAPDVEALARDRERFVLGYVGSLMAWKGVAVLIDAMAILPERFEAHVVGGEREDADREALVRRARERGVSNRIRFTPFVPASRLPETLREVDAFVLPLYDEAHGSSPMKLFEYLAAGRPVLASDLPSVREVVSHGESARLFAPGDPDALAEQARRLVHSSFEERLRMVERGLEAVAPRTPAAWRESIFAWFDTLVL